MPFTSNYKLSEDECFLTSNFKMLSCVKEAIDTPDTLEAFIPQNVQGNAPNGYKIKAILIGRKTENGTYVIAGQKFSKSQIL